MCWVSAPCQLKATPKTIARISACLVAWNMLQAPHASKGPCPHSIASIVASHGCSCSDIHDTLIAFARAREQSKFRLGTSPLRWGCKSRLNTEWMHHVGAFRPLHCSGVSSLAFCQIHRPWCLRGFAHWRYHLRLPVEAVPAPLRQPREPCGTYTRPRCRWLTTGLTH